MEKEKRIFVSEEDVKEYVKMFPRGTEVLMKEVELNCCEEGHTFREIMGYDKPKCEM